MVEITDKELEQLWLMKNCMNYHGTYQGSGWFSWHDLLKYVDPTYDETRYDLDFGYGIQWNKHIMWQVLNNELFYETRWVKTREGENRKLYKYQDYLPFLDEPVCRWKEVRCFIEKMAEWLLDFEDVLYPEEE